MIAIIFIYNKYFKTEVNWFIDVADIWKRLLDRWNQVRMNIWAYAKCHVLRRQMRLGRHALIALDEFPWLRESLLAWHWSNVQNGGQLSWDTDSNQTHRSHYGLWHMKFRRSSYCEKHNLSNVVILTCSINHNGARNWSTNTVLNLECIWLPNLQGNRRE